MNIWLYISVGIGIVIGILDLLMFRRVYTTENSASLIQAWIGTDYRFAYNTLFYILLPIIACLPYAGSYYEDMRSGYDKNICIKTSRKAYILSKMSAVFASAFAAVSLSLIINMFVVAGLYPNNKPDRLDFQVAGIIDCQLFPALFSQHPLWYGIVYTLIDGSFGGLLGILSLAVSRLVENKFSAISIPFIMYVITGILFTGTQKGNWSIMEMINPVQNVTTYGYQMAISYFGVFVVSAFVTWICAVRRDVL